MIKKFLVGILLVIGLFLCQRPALAADTAAGAKVFSTNCAACHAGGRNVVSASKTLKLDALQTNGVDSLEAIINQVTNGKAAMPSFKGRLNPQEIEAVAAYVLEQAQKGWS